MYKNDNADQSQYAEQLAAGVFPQQVIRGGRACRSIALNVVKRGGNVCARISFSLWCGAATLLSAFLVFQIQPVISKMILPWFGGGPAVWTTCLLFFQILLLAGYGYAHCLNRFLPLRKQALVHLSLMVFALFVLPITPDAAWKPLDGQSPTWRIFHLLLANVGLPYFLLSATAPLLQAWFAAWYPGRIPYRLYALSNVGSLVALLSFPFVVEPLLSTSNQGFIWSLVFAGFVGLCGCLAMLLGRPADSPGKIVGQPRFDESEETEHTIQPPPEVQCQGKLNTHQEWVSGNATSRSAKRTWCGWLLLSALGSLTLLAVTNHICQELTVAPLLWVVPLSIYLVTFIISFDRPQWFARRYWGAATLVSILLLALYNNKLQFSLDEILSQIGIPISLYDNSDNVVVQAILSLSALFLICMICHGELVRRKPDPKRLTSFYLAMATGGVVGGIFVAIISPRVFSSYFEMGLALAAGLWLAVWMVFGDNKQRRVRKFLTRGAGVAIASSGAYLVFTGAWLMGGEETLVQLRNFYGVLRVNIERVSANSFARALYDGHTLHGFQYMDRARRHEPTVHFERTSGVGLTLTKLSSEKALRVGVVGLGAGTLAAYGTDDDFYRFYEINPDVIKIARTQFSFLKDSKAQVEVKLGDARVSFERYLQPQNYDVIVLDAFSGDAIPVHLLTVEAFQLYQRHLNPDGVIVVHVSNRYLNLFPVVAFAAKNTVWKWSSLKRPRIHPLPIPGPTGYCCRAISPSSISHRDRPRRHPVRIELGHRLVGQTSTVRFLGF